MTLVSVVSLTCDGPSCHFTMMDDLGCVLDPLDLQAFFVHPHPSNSSLKVYILFDVCHMLKLMRNTLADGGMFLDGDGNRIKWDYIVALNRLQQDEGVHLANKVTDVHINFLTQKMKVNLAAQILSTSCAAAIEFCATELYLVQFHESEATVKFLRLFDHLFDVLKLCNPSARDFKAPLRPASFRLWDSFLDEAFAYILSVKDSNGKAMTSSRRKTPFFLCAIQSIKAIYSEYVAQVDAPLKYLLTYK